MPGVHRPRRAVHLRQGLRHSFDTYEKKFALVDAMVKANFLPADPPNNPRPTWGASSSSSPHGSGKGSGRGKGGGRGQSPAADATEFELLAVYAPPRDAVRATKERIRFWCALKHELVSMHGEGVDLNAETAEALERCGWGRERYAGMTSHRSAVSSHPHSITHPLTHHLFLTFSSPPPLRPLPRHYHTRSVT